jgi:hypothetical protein
MKHTTIVNRIPGMSVVYRANNKTTGEVIEDSSAVDFFRNCLIMRLYNQGNDIRLTVFYRPKRNYALAVKKLVKIEKGRNKGKYKYELQHLTFSGTWEEVEEYILSNNYILVGYDY